MAAIIVTKMNVNVDEFLLEFYEGFKECLTSPPQPALSLVPEKKRTEVCEKKMDELTKLRSFCRRFGVQGKS